MPAPAGFSAGMGSFAPGRGATLAAGKWLAGAFSTSVPAGFPLARGIVIGALGGYPPRTVSGGNAAALAVFPFGWTPAATPNSCNPSFTSSPTAGVFPDAHGPDAHRTCPSAAWLVAGDGAELVGAGCPSVACIKRDSGERSASIAAIM